MPFDWQSLLAFLRLRATPGVESVTGSAYSRNCGSEASPYRLTVTHDPAKRILEIECNAASSEQSSITDRVRRLFKADVDTRKIESFLSQDCRLNRFVTQQPGLRVPGGWSGFEIAARAILGQQVSVAAATTLMGRLVRLCETRINGNDWLFPSPGQVAAANLSALGVPKKRMETLRSLACLFTAQDEQFLQENSAMDSLLAISGVGRWTAGYILMRTSASHDYWPEGDLVLRKAFSSGKKLIGSAELARVFRRWSPYRGYASIHVWRGYVSSANSAVHHE